MSCEDRLKSSRSTTLESRR